MDNYYILAGLILYWIIGVGVLRLAISRYGYDPANADPDHMSPLLVALLWPLSLCIILKIICDRIDID